MLLRGSFIRGERRLATIFRPGFCAPFRVGKKCCGVFGDTSDGVRQPLLWQMGSANSGDRLPSMIARCLFLACSERSLIGDEIKSKKKPQRNNVPHQHEEQHVYNAGEDGLTQDLPGFSYALLGGIQRSILKDMFSVWARKWSRPESIRVKKSSSPPESARETASQVWSRRKRKTCARSELSLPHQDKTFSALPSN